MHENRLYYYNVILFSPIYDEIDFILLTKRTSNIFYGTLISPAIHTISPDRQADTRSGAGFRPSHRGMLCNALKLSQCYERPDRQSKGTFVRSRDEAATAPASRVTQYAHY
jgi:hypothetical protein